MTPNPDLERKLEEAALRYSRSTRPGYRAEAFAQSTQRRITLESFDLIREARPEIHCFSDMLIEFQRKSRNARGDVLLDQFVVVDPNITARVR